MSRRNEYILQRKSTATCPICRDRMELLAPREPTGRLPTFFVCWADKTIVQAGVGPARYE